MKRASKGMRPRNILLLLWGILWLGACKEPTPMAEKRILSFKIENLPSALVTLREAEQRIEIEVPYGTLLTALVPVFELSPHTSSVPASGVAQDFSRRRLYYTLTGADGSKTVYEVLVNLAPRPAPLIVGYERDSVESGEAVTVLGKHFGVFSLETKTFLLDEQRRRTEVPHRWTDSTRLVLELPYELRPGRYEVVVVVSGQEAIAPSGLWVSYPSPQLSRLARHNLTQLDSLRVSGRFFDPTYTYEFVLNGAATFPALPRGSTALVGLVPRSIAAGRYAVRVRNKSLQKRSREEGVFVRVYAADKPFVEGVKSLQKEYKSGQALRLLTRNMASFPTRFYQVSLASASRAYVQNGLYDESSAELLFDLPVAMQGGEYRISVLLVNDAGDSYEIELDDRLVVKE